MNRKLKEKSLIEFWNNNRKKILVWSGIAGTVALTILGVKHYWDNPTFESLLQKSSLQELKDLRNTIHSKYMSHTSNDEYRESLWNCLPKIDNRIREIEWAGKTPIGPSYHGEHGTNLYKAD